MSEFVQKIDKQTTQDGKLTDDVKNGTRNVYLAFKYLFFDMASLSADRNADEDLSCLYFPQLGRIRLSFNNEVIFYTFHS